MRGRRMEFITRIWHSLLFLAGMGARKLRWVAVSALLAAAGLAHFSSRPAQAVQAATIKPALTQQQKLTGLDGTASNRFGTAVAFSGNTAVIGAPGGNGIKDNQGSVYVFTRSGATWALQQKLTAQDGAANSVFGFSVAISGDT